VHIVLERNGIYRNHKTVLEVMQEYNLLSVVRRKKYRNYGTGIHKYPDLLNRDFKADNPNQKGVTDISFIHTKQGVLYLSVIRDLFVNSIVVYKLIFNHHKGFLYCLHKLCSSFSCNVFIQFFLFTHFFVKWQPLLSF